MTEIPADVLAALATEQTMLADPWAEMLDAYNRPTEPMTPAETAAAIGKAMQGMWGYSAPWGASQFSWWCKPPRHLNLFRVGGEWERQFVRSAWQEAGRSAWIECVRERLQSAVYAASNGYGWSWTAPGVFGVPGLPESLQLQDATQPWRPTDDGKAQDV
jgi:hypothetical protein